MSLPLASEQDRKDIFNVVILDDNPADIIAIERTLEEVPTNTYKTFAFANIDNALRFLETDQDQVDICLVDYSLGGHSAFDFLLQLDAKSIRPIPIVVMTSQTDSSIDKKLMLAGVHDYCSKASLNSETLSRCIRYAIHRHQKLLRKSLESENKSRHIAHINHELKNPLNAFYGYSRVLERIWQRSLEGTLSEKDRMRANDCFNVMKQSCELLKKMINELLDFSELSQHGDKIDRQKCSLNEICQNVYNHFEVLATEQNLELSYLPFHQEIEIYGDKQRLFQIASNLVSNAIKYTESGFVRISTQIQVNPKEESWALIIVEDSGVGIARENQLLIFQEYEKVFNNKHLLKKHVDSTGLGLPITKLLVDLHGGNIDLISEPNAGSRFTVYLPIRSS